MKKQHFKYTTLSFVLINIWTLYSFFDYYNSLSESSTGLMTLFFNFMDSVIYASGIGILMILARIIYFRKDRKFKLKKNFFYIFAGLFNLNISVIWVISIYMNMLNFKIECLYYILGNVIPAIFILVDIYVYRENNQIENVIK